MKYPTLSSFNKTLNPPSQYYSVSVLHLINIHPAPGLHRHLFPTLTSGQEVFLFKLKWEFPQIDLLIREHFS